MLLCPPHASPPRLPPTKTATLAHLPACCPHWYSDPRGPNPEPSPERSQLRAASQLRTRSSQVSVQGSAASHPDVTGSSSGVLPGSEPRCKAPLPTTQPKTSRAGPLLGPLWGWAAHCHPAGPPTFTALKSKIFPEAEPQPASQSQTCPEIQTGAPSPDISPSTPTLQS